ncbi:hypothetical protein [Nocardia aurantia]|uniref:hypothetical protein n=1 Tax=Nocardia aurantia TaxID=2585199 RepID=UPI001295B936|nr:hypothetical protein [Nocardia aurantia]
MQREKQDIDARIDALRAADTSRHRMTADEIQKTVASLGELIGILRKADPADKLELYRRLGLKLTYQNRTRAAVADFLPQPPVSVPIVSEGGLEPPRP